MSASKKHPLEVLRESGRSLGGASPPQQADRPDADLEEHPAGAGGVEFRLRGPGLAALLFAWVFLLGAAYLLGYHRGSRAAPSADREALALGRRLERGPEAGPLAGTASPETADARRPWGVLLITYDQWDARRYEELRDTLAERYGVSGLVPWLRNGKVEVFAGAFERKDDPGLLRLAARIRKIRDWPVGDRAPFRSARIRQHPDDPARAAGDDEKR